MEGEVEGGGDRGSDNSRAIIVGTLSKEIMRGDSAGVEGTGGGGLMRQ